MSDPAAPVRRRSSVKEFIEHAKPQTVGRRSTFTMSQEAMDTGVRPKWGSKTEFILTVVGYAVGLGNVWRFPGLCADNGGGAFLIPYFLSLAALGIPLFMLELGVGQWHQIGCVHLWGKIHPLLKGVGVASTILAAMVALYYNVILAWSIYFLGASFTSTLPWDPSKSYDSTMTLAQYTADPSTPYSSPADYFWNNVALQKTADISETGDTNWPMWGCLLLAWIIIFFCIFKGVSSSGKVVYFTAPFPYFVLIILFFRGVTLDGAGEGLKFYLTPQWDKLGDGNVWVAAVSQIFYSLGPGWGSLIAFASYNPKNTDFVKDSIVVALINCFTSFFAGFVIFSVMGFVAHTEGKSVADIAASVSPEDLAFILYPTALAQMPAAPFFSILFFLMLLCLGIDSEFAMVEAVMTACVDAGIKMKKEHIAMTVCSLSFLVGWIFVTGSGTHWVSMFNGYSTLLSLFPIAFLEVIAIFWIYGSERYLNDVESMTGRRLSPLWGLYNKYVVPVLLAFLSCYSVYTGISASDASGYSSGYTFIAFMVALVSVFPLIGYAVKNHFWPPVEIDEAFLNNQQL